MSCGMRASKYLRLLPKPQWRTDHVELLPRQSRRTNTTKKSWNEHKKLSDEEEFERKLWLPPRQGSIVTKDPNQTSVEDIATNLRRNFRMTGKFWRKFTKRASIYSNYDQALVILATPGYAKWLENDTLFIPLILESLVGAVKAPKTETLSSLAPVVPNERKGRMGPTEAPFEIDIVCACVDGLAPNVDIISQQNKFSLVEGFSFLQGRTNQILPGLWESESTKIGDTPGMQSSLTFSSREGISQITLPLANTLFRNGKSSTLLVSRWQRQPDQSYKKIRSEEKSNQQINVFDYSPLGIPSSSINVIPLTPARRIVSGLGNIVRQIQFDDQVGPASQELEKNIDEYLEVIDRPKSTVAVWALVIPIESLPNSPPEPPNDLLLNSDSVKRLWQDPSWRKDSLQNPSHRSTFVGHWIDRGATMCRVLSGGGGWGVKQGLLSLDPQTTYSVPSEARFDFSTGSLEEQQNVALGRIAHPNALIQFFIASNNGDLTPWTKVLNDMQTHQKGCETFQKGTVIGAVPSTIDDVPVPPVRDGGYSSNRIYFQMGHFGAVSESGMYYNSSAVKDPESEEHVTAQNPISTKIDVPYSFIFRDYRTEVGTKRVRHVLGN